MIQGRYVCEHLWYEAEVKKGLGKRSTMDEKVEKLRCQHMTVLGQIRAAACFIAEVLLKHSHTCSLTSIVCNGRVE